MVLEQVEQAVAGQCIPLAYLRDWRSSRKNGKDIAVPRIPDLLLDGAAFMFQTRAAAERRAKSGGTAFLVSKIIANSKERVGRELYIPYLISCRHVIFSAGASVISVNRWDGEKPDIIETEPTDWVEHPAGDDVAAMCAIHMILPSRHRLSHIQTGSIITDAGITKLDIGVGDEVLMVGRFVNHQGQTNNRAAARFGSISMMPEDIWVKDDSRFQRSYAVEMRSRTGFSGSAVAVYRTRATVLADVKHSDFWGILGVNWGYINDEDGENTWLNGVVPGARILELLEVPTLKNRHEELEQEFYKIIREQGEGGAVQAFADATPPATDANPNHLKDFTRLVDVAARKRPQGDQT
jgi:hypothetical protein